MNREEALNLLPAPKKATVIKPENCKILLIGPPKWGKTTFFSQFPDALLLAFEEGYAFQEGIPVIAIDKWEGRHDPYEDELGVGHHTMKKVLEILEAVPDRFKFIIFDTADAAVKCCADYKLSQKGIEHASDAGDYGKGFDIVQNTPFRMAVNRIVKSGRGVGFISHSDTRNEKFATGEKSKRISTLPSGIWKMLYAQCDLILHASFGVKVKGSKYVPRILQCEGDSDAIAGQRLTKVKLPDKYIVDPSNSYEQFATFFQDSEASEEAYREFRNYLRPGKQKKKEEEEDESVPSEESGE